MGARRAHAPAKLNLSLEVNPRDASGLHPVRGLTQSISWHDILVMKEADEDHLTVHGADLPTGDENLVWRAVSALRRPPGDHPPARFEVWKRIPVAAGLAGGSSDAAAALLLYGGKIGLESGQLDRPATRIGADVRFCLHGGLRWIEGHGERIGPRLARSEDYEVVVVVPPFLLETPRVYAAWDRLGGPGGRRVSGSDLPPSIRSHGPLANDLYPAAISIEPLLDDWRAEMEARWDRPVLMSGSGPSLFSFFADRTEAEEALELVPSEARSAFAASTLGHGAALQDAPE